MKYLAATVCLLLSSTTLFSQKLCKTDILNGEKTLSANQLVNFKKYDFSGLWLETRSDLIYGVIGDDNQRILIKILSAKKNISNPVEYFILGKSNVKGNVCDFSGKITIQKIETTKRTSFGVDDEFKNLSKTQGLLIANYEFFEKNVIKHSGVFVGELKTKWYLSKNDLIKYDNLNAHSDGYFNNAFIGVWKMYNSNLVKKCNWGDYRVPDIDCDFDIGVGTFNVSEKYRNKGWLDIALEDKPSNDAAIEFKASKEKKEWWQ